MFNKTLKNLHRSVLLCVKQHQECYLGWAQRQLHAFPHTCMLDSAFLGALTNLLGPAVATASLCTLEDMLLCALNCMLCAALTGAFMHMLWSTVVHTLTTAFVHPQVSPTARQIIEDGERRAVSGDTDGAPEVQKESGNPSFCPHSSFLSDAHISCLDDPSSSPQICFLRIDFNISCLADATSYPKICQSRSDCNISCMADSALCPHIRFLRTDCNVSCLGDPTFYPPICPSEPIVTSVSWLTSHPVLLSVLEKRFGIFSSINIPSVTHKALRLWWLIEINIGHLCTML